MTNTDEQARAERRARQTDDIYRALGRVVVEVSQLMGSMDSSMRTFIGHDMANNYAEGPAKVLVEKFFEVGETINHWHGQDTVVVAALRTQVLDLLKRRNRMFHDYWYVGWSNQQATEWSGARRMQIARLDPGQQPQLTEWKAADIEAFADEVAEHVAMVRHLGMVMRVPEWAVEYPPRANLAVDDDGKVHPWTGPL